MINLYAFPSPDGEVQQVVVAGGYVYLLGPSHHYDVRRVPKELELVDQHLSPGPVSVRQPEEVEQQLDVVCRQVQLFFCYDNNRVK